MSTQQPFETGPEQTPTDPQDTFTVDDGGVLYEDQVTPEYGVLGFTLRELIIVGAWLVAFVVSFFPVGWAPSLWSQGIAWILPIGVPTVAVFLIVLRRFSPDGIRRVGSLGIDQFASVAFSVSAMWWAQLLWDYVASVVQTGANIIVWVPWVEFVAMLALVGVTVFAFLIPGLKEDFQGRLETLAHRNANPVRPVIARPRAEKPHPPETVAADDAADDTTALTSVLDVELSGQHATDEVARLDLAGQVPLSAHASGGDTGSALADDDYVPGYARRSRQDDAADHARAQAEDEVAADDSGPLATFGLSQAPESDSGSASESSVADAEIAATMAAARSVEVEPSAPVTDVDATNPRWQAAAAQPFWALAPTERDVVDERGEPLFRIGPTAWALVIEDRGGAYVIRHDDGRIGYLHDIADITKG